MTSLSGRLRALLSTSSSQSNLIFSGSSKCLNKNGAILLEERISLFDGRTNSIRSFSVDDLNSMNVNSNPIIVDTFYTYHAGAWHGKSVMVKIFRNDECSSNLACRDIAIASQMATHSNAYRILGCCLNTNCPVLVYEWPENGTLYSRVLSYNEQREQPIEWKDRLRIAWEISHAVAYMHTAFSRPIIHRDLRPQNIFLDRDCSAKLSDFCLSISIPKGKTHVKDDVKGALGYLAPEYMELRKVSESSDVFGFGVFLLVLLTGKPAIINSKSHHGHLVDCVSECLAANCLGDIVDPAIATNGAVDEQFQHQLKSVVELALRCSAKDEACRPTMVDVATQLKMIRSWSYSL